MRSRDKVSNDFNTLIEFLDRFGPEASGRSFDQPGNQEAEKLQLFAQGKCNQAQVEEMCELLRTHPAWIRWVADRIRMARQLKTAEA